MRFGSRGVFAITTLAAGLWLSACNYSIRKTPLSDIPSPTNYKQSELTFGFINERVFRTSCVGCHGTSGGVNLESYESVKANLGKIFQTSLQERRMPKAPTPALTEDQLGLLNAWIQMGAPEAQPGTGPAPTPPPLAPNFDSIKYHVLETKCLLCHAPGKPVARIPLVTKEDLLNSPLELVIPGNPEESGLMIAIWGLNPEKLMPPPKDSQGNPTGLTKLSDFEIETIAQWIANGAQD